MFQDRNNSIRGNTNAEHGEQEPEAEIGEEQTDKQGGKGEVKARNLNFREEVPTCTHEEADKG